MIITALNGGLGNQMFQYAIARSLSIKNNTEIKLDISAFETYKLRTYELHCFNIEEKFSTRSEVADIKEKSRYKRFYCKLKHKLQGRVIKLVNEPYFHFDANILKLEGNLYLQGYWQAEKYFKDIEDIIRKDFSLRGKLSEESGKIASQIKEKSCPVSLHVRRGDYISNPITNQYHGTCSLEYYEKCLELLKDKFDNIALFVFSDDPVWAKENLHFEFPMVFVNKNGAEKAYEDIYLMSQCRHHIIANSSFSWWGAWLNPKKDKMVFAPKVWFRDQTKDTRDLIPEHWSRV